MCNFSAKCVTFKKMCNRKIGLVEPFSSKGYTVTPVTPIFSLYAREIFSRFLIKIFCKYIYGVFFCVTV